MQKLKNSGWNEYFFYPFCPLSAIHLLNAVVMDIQFVSAQNYIYQT